RRLPWQNQENRMTSSDVIDDPVEEQLRRRLEEAHRKVEEANRQPLPPEVTPANIITARDEAYEAWQRLETTLRAKGAPEMLKPDFGEREMEIPDKQRAGSIPVVPGFQERPDILAEKAKSSE